MGVQSYLSLYTVLLGWQSYDALWDIMTQLGLVMLPFAFIATKCFMEPFLSMGAKDAGVIGSRRFIVSMLTALFVLLFAGAPMVHLEPTLLHYTPHCETNAKTATPGNTGTTYDSLSPTPSNVKVPMIFYIVMAVSNGITNAAENKLSCPSFNLRSLQNQLNLAAITSTDLKSQVQRFSKSCYLPAYNRLVEDNNSGSNQAAIQTSLTAWGNEDVSWIGSETFQRVPGFYDSFSAQAPVVGFSYTSSGIDNQVNAQTQTPLWGAPTCLAWWQTPKIGLRDELFNEFSGSFRARIAMFGTGSDHIMAKNMAIRTMIVKSTGSGFFDPGFATEQDNQSGVNNFLAKWASKVMIDYEALSEYPKIQILKNALPIIQAVISAALYMLLAIALPLSGYSIRFVIVASVFMFTVIFCSYLWHWVSWYDQYLLEALYGAAPVTGHPDPGQLIWNLGQSSLNPEKNLVDLTISGFYIIIPVMWLGIVNWCGIAASSALGLGGSEGFAQRAGGKGVGYTDKVAGGVHAVVS